MMPAMIRIALLAALAAALSVAACGPVPLRELRKSGYGERCADIMRQSFSGARIEFTMKHVAISTTEHGGLGLMIADVAGVRPNIPATGGFLAREVAARCRFQNGILTEFRWTKGPYR
jgi:hypothetical protein